MKNPVHLLLPLLCAILLSSCKKDQPAIPEPILVDKPVKLVQAVTWDVGVTHKMSFIYNPDSTLQSYTTESSNLPLKYTGVFIYANKQAVEMIYDGVLVKKYLYTNNKVTQKIQLSTDGTVTGRFTYNYNALGSVSRLRVEVALYGILSLSQDISYIYDSTGTLTETRSDRYNEKGEKDATVVRKYKSWSDELHINPVSLLHSLYQHQARDIFDDIILSTLNRLPVKIAETGNPEIGPVSYEYSIVQKEKQLMSLNCTIKIKDTASYTTNTAVFHY